MNRRLFLQRVCGGIVGTVVAAKLPTAWLPEPVQRYAACEYLRQEFNAWTRGRMQRDGVHFLKALPSRMTAGRELFEAFEGEIVANMRFVPYGFDAASGPPTLMFKGVPLVQHGSGWRCECHA